ncbi:MAG: CDP-diacylglycerol--glycerol-3-phosphate 3-phosphatidyltransferase [Aquificae bacterium]|nr:CDP-diacylglycerol--glycerol-3-phosphate 3-phosphatidyltransferase [Aquificota bacterium]
MASILTVSRIFLSFPVVFLVLAEEYTAALVLFILGALTDWFDGNLARKNAAVSDFGKLLDPFADKVFVLLPLIALVDTGRVSSVPVILLTFRELSISFLRSLSVERGYYMEASFLGKLKAFSEFVAVALLLGGVELGLYVLFLAVVLAYVSALDYLRRFASYTAP